MTSCLSYVSNNLGPIILSSIFKSFGLGGKSLSSRNQQDQPDPSGDENPPSSTILQTVWNGLQITYPYIKDIAQPLILGFLTDKIKKMFSKKDKKDDK